MDGIECLVSDDSRTDDVLNAVRNHRLFKEARLTYIHNKGGKGAVNNWNKLMDSATGDFLLFMHHDEYPRKPSFYALLFERLYSMKELDILVLRCCKTWLAGERFRAHMPYRLTRLVTENAPSMLLLHNVVGSPSNIVLRNARKLYFDESLRWLVDVEWMVRLISQPHFKVRVSKDLEVLSVYHAPTSITKSLGNNLGQLRQIEFSALDNSLKNRKIHKLIFSKSFFWASLRTIERVLWWLFRGFHLIFGTLTSKPTKG